MRVSKLNVAARSCSLSRTLMQTDTDTGAAATQWERRRRKMLSVLRSPFYAHFKIFAVSFVSFFYFIWLLVFFASFLCTVSLFFLCLFLIKTRCCCCYCCLPLLVWPTLFWWVSLCVSDEKISTQHTHTHATHDDDKVEEEAAVAAAASAANRGFAYFQVTQKQQQTWEQQHQWSTPRSRLHFCRAR